jgi:SpoVK/Ycf46/Vps4 family AAA+-type ATPase
MGKKKKPSTPSFSDDGRALIRSEEFLQTKTTRQTVITVRQAVKHSSTTTESSNNKPTVWMHEDDMVALDVLAGEKVILLSRAAETDNEDSISGAAVCTVATSKTGTKNALKSGFIHISPSCLSDMLHPTDLVAEETIHSPGQPCLNNERAVVSPTPTPATPSPSRFSFKQGGGGDLMYSPTSSIGSPSPRNKSGTQVTPNKRNAPLNRVWVIPMDSKLGRVVQKRLLSVAASVSMNVLDESLVLTAAEAAVLKRIVLANCCGWYLQDNQSVTVSFRGKSLSLKVCTLQSRKEALEAAMQNLDLSDDELDETQEEKEIEQLVTKSSLRLMEMTYTSVITIQGTETVITNQPAKKPTQYVVGLSSTLEEVRTLLLTPLRHPDLFSGSLKPPRGILVYGSSGSGKTCIIKQLELELEQEFCVEVADCTLIQSKTAVVGEAERELSRLFHHDSGVATKPKLIIMDDIHLICSKRGGYGSSTDQLAATLLSLMDGVDAHKNRIFVLATTTSPSMLDRALRRPGRLDSEVEVPLPDEPSTRADILRFHSDALGADVPAMSENDWLELGKLAKGFNGADCMLAVKEALRLAIRNISISTDSDNIPLTIDCLRAAIKATKPSAIKAVTVEIPHVKWSDIGGMDSVKAQLRNAIELPLTHGDAMAQLGIPPPRGILLYGPPGCSKTLMARALATEGQMNFLAVKGPELLSKWLGESERALASLFRRARLASPSIIFFDEIDSIATKRGSSDSASSSRLLSQLLTELDGVNYTATDGKKQRVVVVGATNRPDLLDLALTRPGRIDRMIYVDVPDYETRKQIFDLNLKHRACSNDIDVLYLAQDKITGGFSGAEVVAICRDAALLALEETEDPMSELLPAITMKHMLTAVNGTKRQITPDMLAFYASFASSQSQLV